MKKLLALVVAALMLFSALAVAEEAPVGGKQLTIKDVVVDLGGGQMLDLSGIELVLAAAAGDDQIGLRAAIEGAGASILNAIAAIDEEQIAFHVDGLSDVYSIKFADLQAMMDAQDASAEAFQSGFQAGYNFGSGLPDEDMEALIDSMGEIISGCATPAGTEVIDSVEYQIYDIAISEDEMAQMLDAWIEMLDTYGQSGLEGTGYDSYRQMFDDANIRLSVDGKLYQNDADAILSVNLNGQAEDMTEAGVLNLYAEIAESEDGAGTDFAASISAIDGEDVEQIGAVTGSYVEVDGAFGSIELYLYTPDSADSGIYVNVYAPSTQGNGLWQFSIGSVDETEPASFHLAFGNADGLNQLYVQVLSGEQLVYLNYSGKDGVGNLDAAVMQGDTTLGGFSATVEVADDDGSWLPGEAGQTVDIMTIDQTQMQKVSSEGMALLLNAVYGISQANPDLGMMISNMMSGTMG